MTNVTADIGRQVAFSVPWAALCSDNAKAVPKRGGKGITNSTSYREAKNLMMDIVAIHCRNVRHREPFEGPVFVRATVHFPIDQRKTQRKRDAPNWTKLILDAMKGKVYVDDDQVKRYLIEEGALDAVGGATIVIVPLLDWEPPEMRRA